MEKNSEIPLKKRLTFRKEERLCSKKVIAELFENGETIMVYPFKVLFMKHPKEQKSPVQAAFTVGKRNFKLAVHRTEIKRKIREAYRLNKHILYDEIKKDNLVVFFIYIGKEIHDFRQVENAMKKGIKRIIKEISKVNTQND
jgi:ribonuclease P protein component